MSTGTARCFSTLAIAAALSACAGNPSTAELRPIEPGSTLTVTVNLPELKTPNALDAAEATGKGAGEGAVYGMGIGFEGSFHTCGPFFFICAPFTMAIGGASGAVIGGAYGASTALPAEEARQLEAIVRDYVVSEDIALNLRNDFVQQQDGRWEIVEVEGDVSVILGVEKLAFEQRPGGQLAILLTSNLVIRYGPEDSDVTKRLLLNARTESYPVDHWVADDGANTLSGLGEVFTENSRQIVAILSQPVRTR